MIKKLLFLLLPVIAFGQDMKLDHSVIEAGPYAVGDTITVKFNTLDVAGAVPTLIQFDYQYNNKLLQKINHSLILPNNQSALTSVNHWDGYVWTDNANYTSIDLSGQRGNGTYSVNANWSVERITIQDGVAIDHNETIIEVTFVVKDKINTPFTDYSEVTNLNWVYSKNNSDGTVYDVESLTDVIDLGDIAGGVLNAVTIRLETPVVDKSQYSYTITDISDDTIAASGTFDSAGDAIVAGLVDGVQYRVQTYLTDNTEVWLDDVVTVSDVFLVFNYMSSTDIDGNGTGTFDYYLQKLFANAHNTQGNWSADVNDDDSYVFLAYLAGTLPAYDQNDPDTFRPLTSTMFGAMNYSRLSFLYGIQGSNVDPSLITPTPSDVIFTFAHGFGGDVDLSHSHTPAVSGYSNSVAKSGEIAGKVKQTNFQKTAETSNLDITTQLVNGKVVLEISTTKAGMAGAQINLTYDTNVLDFDQVVFDTGNTMTNFANHKNGKIFVGSLDLRGGNTVKTGKPYKVIFTPKQAITNTAGLVSFGVTEGVKTDGTKVKFNIQ